MVRHQGSGPAIQAGETSFTNYSQAACLAVLSIPPAPTHGPLAMPLRVLAYSRNGCGITPSGDVEPVAAVGVFGKMSGAT